MSYLNSSQLYIYGYRYKTHFLPLMLVSFSMCVFAMILKYCNCVRNVLQFIK